jgi:signal transduction histidine kinase
VWNLLNNAAKFTSAGGHVQVSLSRRPSEIVLSVADTGIGIPPDFMRLVVPLFQRPLALQRWARHMPLLVRLL